MFAEFAVDDGVLVRAGEGLGEEGKEHGHDDDYFEGLAEDDEEDLLSVSRLPTSKTWSYPYLEQRRD